MSRIQVLPLPPVKAGEYEQTPFILVIDQIGDDEAWSEVAIEYVKQQTGAALVLAHEGTVDAPGQLDLTDEQRDTLHQYLTEPARVMLGVEQALKDVDMARHYVVPQRFLTGL